MARSFPTRARNNSPPKVPAQWVRQVSHVLAGLKEGSSVYVNLTDSPYNMPDVRVKVMKGPRGNAYGSFKYPLRIGVLPKLSFYGGYGEETVQHELIHLIQWMLGSRELPPSASAVDHFNARNAVWKAKGVRRGTGSRAVRGTTYHSLDVEFYPHISHASPLRGGQGSRRPWESEFLIRLKHASPKMYREALRQIAAMGVYDDYPDEGRLDYREREKSIREGGYVDLYALWGDARKGDSADSSLGKFIAGPGGSLYRPVIDEPAPGYSIPSLVHWTRVYAIGSPIHLSEYRNPHAGRWHVVDMGNGRASFAEAWAFSLAHDRALRSPAGILYLPGGSARSPEVLNPKTGQTVPADVARTGMLGWNTTRAP